jgi:hypothetical protein
MKPRIKNNHHLLFPVNYPKNHQENTTMNEAQTSRPKSSKPVLNSPEIFGGILKALRNYGLSPACYVIRSASAGSLILSRLLCRMFFQIHSLFLPWFIIIAGFQKMLNNKLVEAFDEFFRFMDYFFMMGEELWIQETAVEYIGVEDQINPIRSKVYKRLHVRLPDSHMLNPVRSVVSGLHQLSMAGAKTNLGTRINYAAFLDSSKEDFFRDSDSAVIAGFARFWKMIFLINKSMIPNLKLPFNASIIKPAFFRQPVLIPVIEITFTTLDAFVLREFTHNQFAHKD